MKYKLINPLFFVMLFIFLVFTTTSNYAEAKVIDGPQTKGSVKVEGRIGDTSIVEDNEDLKDDDERITIIADTSLINKGTFPKTGEVRMHRNIYIGVFLILIVLFMTIRKKKI